MNIDPETLKQLIATFQIELLEQSQLITDGLLLLEKDKGSEEERIKTIEAIFRSAHNIKGASRSIGVTTVSDIAHKIESIFSQIKNNIIPITTSIITLCLEAIDKMNQAFQDYSNKTQTFDLAEILLKLEHAAQKPDEEKPEAKKREPIPKKANVSISKNNKMSKLQTPDAIRVSLNQLDHIAALMEEMQLNKIGIDDLDIELKKLSVKSKQQLQLEQKVSSILYDEKMTAVNKNLQKIYNTSIIKLTEINNQTQQITKNMHNRLNELSVLSNSLQEEVRLLRLIPASTLLRDFNRIVRDLAHELHKDIELTITGDEVKMDKLVLENLHDPLIHLLRNAIDHGIESPEIREKHGKPKTGHIHIDLKEEGNKIIISITDDGAGVDTNKIKMNALKNNLTSQTELDKMDEKSLLNYIFISGFSTKGQITDVSGRGVGLDVVKNNVEFLKGELKVATELGKGTTFTLIVPLTLASERGLTVSCNNDLYVIPIRLVERVLMLPSSAIVEVEGNQAILIDEHPITLRSLSDLLELETKKLLDPNHLFVLVMKNNAQRVAIQVEAILGEREIVIKPLKAPLVHIPCVSGGTLSGSGQIILVLNASELIEKALLGHNVLKIHFQEDQIQKKQQTHILVVDDSITTRTLEKNILESNNYKVTVAVDGKAAWNILANEIFSLVITDINMPNIDGFTLTEMIKNDAELKNTPVIIVTSLDSDVEKRRGLEVGADAYIVKSEFESGALLDIVSRLV